MCRAVWAIVYAANLDAAKALRGAAGAEVEVVAMAKSTDELTATIATTRADVVIVDGSAPAAATIATMLAAKGSGIAWVGEGAPDGAVAIAWSDRLGEDLPAAITRALIARKKA